jgi:hypothetical protein
MDYVVCNSKCPYLDTNNFILVLGANIVHVLSIYLLKLL